MPMSEIELRARDAQRDIGQDLLAAVREMKAGKVGRVHQVAVPVASEVRAKAGLSQGQFAAVLGVSRRTLQEWEQGRRQPNGAARVLLTLALKRPDVLRELAAGGLGT